MIDDHGKEFSNLKDKVAVVEKAGDGSESSSAIKADISYLKKEVVFFWSVDMSTFLS